jgi:hypothetical protein
VAKNRPILKTEPVLETMKDMLTTGKQLEASAEKISNTKQQYLKVSNALCFQMYY